MGVGRAVFKARTGELNKSNNTYVNPVDGIYLKTEGIDEDWIGTSKTVVETGDNGTKLDSEAVFPVDTPVVAEQSLVVDELSIERESLRGSALVVTVGFTGTYLDEGKEVDVEFAGIYLTTVEALTR
jgi:hypothetical protein